MSVDDKHLISLPTYKTIIPRIKPAEIVIVTKKVDKNVSEAIIQILVNIKPERLNSSRATKTSEYYSLNQLKGFIEQILSIPDLVKYSEEGEVLIKELNEAKNNKKKAVVILLKLYQRHMERE